MSELYVKCPRCLGHKMVSAITRMGDGFTPTRSEYFSCPLCRGTGEASREDAAQYIADQAEREEA